MKMIYNPDYNIKPLAESHPLMKSKLPGHELRLTVDYAKLAASYSQLHKGQHQIDHTNYKALNLVYPNNTNPL